MGTRKFKSLESKNRKTSIEPCLPSADLIEKTSKRKKHHSPMKNELDEVKYDEFPTIEELKTQEKAENSTTSSVNESAKHARRKKKKSSQSCKTKSRDVDEGGEISPPGKKAKTLVATGEFSVTEVQNVSRKKKRSLASNGKNKADNSVRGNDLNKVIEDYCIKEQHSKEFQSGVEEAAKEDNAEKVSQKKKSLASKGKNKADNSVRGNKLNKSVEDYSTKEEHSKKFHSGVEETAKEENAEFVYEIPDVDTDCSKGMKKWLHQYWSRRPGLKILQDNIDQFLTEHEAAEEKARKEREALAAEEGWTVVVHHKGRKKTTDAETGVTVGSVAPSVVLGNLANKRKKELPLDFYRFQKREAKRNEVMQLQSKFEQEKRRIQQLRAARKFRPY